MPVESFSMPRQDIERLASTSNSSAGNRRPRSTRAHDSSRHRNGNRRYMVDPNDNHPQRQHRSRRHENFVIMSDLARMRGGKDHSEISCCVKYTVFSFNVIFWLVGFALLMLGAWMLAVKNPFSQIGSQLTKIYLDPAFVLIVIGAIIFIVGFSGCIGALRENTFFLAAYSTMLGVILLLLGALVVIFIVGKEWITTEIRNELDGMIVHYRDDPDLQSIIDWMQQWLHCCGIDKADDWDLNIYFNVSSVALGSPEAGGVPFSCCAVDDKLDMINLYCGHGVRLDSIHTQSFYTDGCFRKLIDWFNLHVQYVGFAFIAMSVLMILGICFAQNLRSDVFAQRSRWRHRF